jgi:AraC-like DNA-binding protein
MVARPAVRAWRPRVPGVAEVFHAHFTDHAYPMHAHDSWALLIIDAGMVRYDLERHERGALTDLVTLLPPHVPHNGRAAGPYGFRKRVLYVDSAALPDDLIGPLVNSPAVADPVLRHRIDQLHRGLARAGNELEAESRLALILERLHRHWAPREAAAAPVERTVAGRLRDLLDARVVDGLTLQEAAEVLHSTPTHLVRAFSGRFGMPPHQYLMSRRVDLARGLLLAGRPVADVAADAGFYDQSHLHRHFRRIVGTSPGAYAAGT